MRRWRFISGIFLCLVLVGTAACNPFGGGGQGVQQLEKVVRGNLITTVSGSGNIEVDNEANIAFATGGRIDKIYVSEGDKVTKGAVLARLDTSVLELALVQARVARDEAEYNLNQLRDVQHAAYDRVRIAEAQLAAAEQAVAEAKKQLDQASITAPFAGLVASTDADEGDTVSPVMPIIHLIDPSSMMEVNAEVDEIDVPQVKTGQRVTIEIDALPALKLEGKVFSISLLPKVQAGVVVYNIKVRFDASAAPEVKVGMSADADIIVNERDNVLLVPSRAITTDSQGRTTVKVMVNGQVESRPVAVGISDSLQTEIVSGLSEGDLVVLESRGG